MNNSKRLLTASLGALALMLAHAGISQAQFGVNNPWGRSVHGNPVVYGPNYLGTLPNGTPVINPWNRGTVVPAVPAWQTQFGYQYATYNAMNVWNPGLAPYWGAATGLNNAWAANAALAQGALLQPGGFGPGIQPIPIQDNIVGVSPGVQQGPFTQLEPGFFAGLAPTWQSIGPPGLFSGRIREWHSPMKAHSTACRGADPSPPGERTFLEQACTATQSPVRRITRRPV